MYKVYWTENGQTKGQDFDEEINDAMKLMEQLRLRKHNGENLMFISLSCESTNCVGKMGVDVTGPDYDWKKRRI